jgi:FeS assembly SUF system protein
MRNDVFQDKTQIEEIIISVLKTIYDPEIPVNIYELGLIYGIEIDEEYNVVIQMTLTAPNCPVADNILNEVKDKISFISGVKSAIVNLTFDPPWDQSMMSEEAQLELGYL